MWIKIVAKYLLGKTAKVIKDTLKEYCSTAGLNFIMNMAMGSYWETKDLRTYVHKIVVQVY